MTEELLAKLEAATGPDRALDAEIWCALLHPEDKPSKSRPGFAAVTDEDPARWGYKEVEHYTASLDAALALVERSEFRLWTVDASIAGRFSVMLTSKCKRPLSDDEGRRYDGYLYERGDHGTLPLALCLALLRASKARGEAGSVDASQATDTPQAVSDQTETLGSK